MFVVVAMEVVGLIPGKEYKLSCLCMYRWRCLVLLLVRSRSYHVCGCSGGGRWSYSWQGVQVIMFVVVMIEVVSHTPGKEYKLSCLWL
jgi:hypothetical protein